MELQDWVVEYVKARNAIRRTMHEYMVEGDEVTFLHKHKVHHFLISPELQVPEPRDHYTVACLNTAANRKFLIEHWEEFQQDNLWVLFANPDENASWMIAPKVHAMVADEKNLGSGLDAMASEVPEV